MPLIFSTPPVILATYHYWRCPVAPAARPVLTTEAVMTERRWATTLSPAPEVLTVMYFTQGAAVFHLLQDLCVRGTRYAVVGATL